MSVIRLLRQYWFALGLAAVFILPWIAFGRALFQGYAPIDDGFLIVGNPIVHGIDWQRIYLAFTTFDPELYIPLTLLSFQIDWLLAAGNPQMFHVTNLLFHSVNALLVTAVLLQITKRKGLAVVAGILFAIHPLNTEAAVWIAGRKDLLCTTFFLLSFLSFRHWKDGSTHAWILAALSCFVLALLSKALAATLPALLLLDAILLPSKRRTRNVAIMTIPFFAVSAAFLYIATFGKEQVLGSSSLWETMIMAQKSAAFYLLKFFVPTGLTPIHPYQGDLSMLLPTFFVPALCNVALLILAVWQWRRRPLLTCGILLYFIALSPTFFNFHKGDLLFFAVDRYVYIPMIGLLLAVLPLASELFERFRVTQWIQLSVVGIIGIVFTVSSILLTGTWNSPDALFGRAIKIYPESVSARMALSSILRERNDLEPAFSVLRDGLLFSDHPGLNVEAGLIYSANGQVPEAKEQFTLALKKNPSLPPPAYYLGFLAEHEKNNALAEQWYRQAVINDPSYVTARVHLARLLLKQNDIQGAFEQLTQALRWNPVSDEATEARRDLAQQTKASDEEYWTQQLEWIRK